MITQGINRPLWKQDSKGKARKWFMELDGPRYRTHSGLADGKMAVSAWTVAVPASKPTAEEQAAFEVEAKYAHQLAREYHDSIDTIATPNFIQPMLAKTYKSFPGFCWSQPKYDGMRCIASKKGPSVILTTREGQPIVSVPHIIEALEPLFEANPTLILDGELYSHDLHDDFNEIMHLCRKEKPNETSIAATAAVVEYFIYDCPSLPGDWKARWMALTRLITSPLGYPIQLSEWDEHDDQASLDTSYDRYVEDNYEGQIIRLPNVPYEFGARSKSCLKRKEFQTDEFKLKAFLPGNGNWSGAAKRARLALPDGREFGAGVKGKKDLLVQRLALEISDAAEVTLRFFGYTPDGIPRFPVVIDFHPEGRKD